MRMLKYTLTIMTVMVLAAPVYAQDAAPAAAANRWAYASLALAFAAALAALGQSRVAGAACESLARNPAARPGIQIALILGLAFIESLVLFTWVMFLLAGLGVV